MAATEESLALVELHRQSQSRLSGMVAADIYPLTQLIDYDNIAGSYRSIEPYLLRIIVERGAQAEALAAEFYAAIRTAESISGLYTPRGADALDLRKVQRNLRIVGPGKAGKMMQLGQPNVEESMFTNLAGEAQRNVVNRNRSATVNTGTADKKCVGWVRVTDGNPCAFCAMLASRGPVFKDAKMATAGSKRVRKTRKLDGIKVDGYRAHPNCGCIAKPVYAPDDPWPGRGEEFRKIWDESTVGESGKNALNAFRRELARLQREAVTRV